jgi:hypothetical protein
MEAEEAAAASEAFFAFMVISFGPLDLMILGALALGGIYFMFGRSKGSSSDTADKFKQYSIQ